MAKTAGEIAGKLKELIDKNGPAYLVEEPYRVYNELIETKSADRKTAGAILCFLVSGMAGNADHSGNEIELSKAIQKECGFNKRVTDRLAEIILCLYSSTNRRMWKKMDGEGLQAFLDEEFVYTWKGFAVWDEGNGTVDCSYEANIVLKPTEEAAKDKELTRLLKKNPFMEKDEIHKVFEKKLREYLDYEFEEYCTEDDYYQPVVEDFEIEYRVTEWSKKNGFEVIACDGDGGDGGYEPKLRKGWN